MSERVEQLLQAGNEASARVRNLWITFLLFGTYLAIAIGGTTHRQMLLESPIVLPILGAELPLVDFYRIAPGLFLVFHFYMLVQLYLLADKLRKFDAALRYPFVLKDAQKDLRTRTDNFLITQLLVGRQRVLLVRMFIWLAAWLTMVVAPVVLLLAFQIRFLAYHDVLTTWIQRAFLIADILLVWLLWPAVTSREGGLGGAVVALFWKPWVGLYRTLYLTVESAAASYRSGNFWTYLKVGFSGYTSFRRTWNQFLHNLFGAILTIVASVGVIGFSILVATIPAEPIERWLLHHEGPDERRDDWWISQPYMLAEVDIETMRSCLIVDESIGWRWNWWAIGKRSNSDQEDDIAVDYPCVKLGT